MAVWAYECRLCADREYSCFVSADQVAQFPADTRIVQVLVNRRWRCAELRRDQRFEVDAMLLRSVIATDAPDCSACEEGEDA